MYGAGLAAVRKTLQLFGHSCDVMAMDPFPPQCGPWREDEQQQYQQLRLDLFEQDESKARRTLSRHFAQLGFQRLPGSSLLVRGLLTWGEFLVLPLDDLEDLEGE